MTVLSRSKKAASTVWILRPGLGWKVAVALTAIFVQRAESEDIKETMVSGSGHRVEDAVIGSVGLTR